MDPRLVLVAALFHQVLAADEYPDGNMSYIANPILEYQPAFVRSLPIQVFLNGIIFTLTCVLFLHLLFTAQYHWPLAPVNFVLQISGVLSLLISQIATLHVVTSATMAESQSWPYMLAYLAVDIPPLNYDDGWSTAELAAWLMMNAATSGLIQITHIQFMTLLYPSTLERRLIYLLLAPLAIVSAVMQLLPIHSNPQVVSWADAVRNICNATLSLLFTLSLVLWGFFVKRGTAWRTDGGTAAFGAGAISLTVASTVLNFAYIPTKAQFDWLPPLIGAIILWQNFLGWWWWVGSGMTTYSDGKGVEEALRREEKKDKKRKARKARRSAQREKAKVMLQGVTDVFRARSDGDDAEGRPSGSPPPPLTRRDTGAASNNSSSAGSTTASEVVNLPIPRFFVRWYLLWRHAHRTAVREQAAERTERINNAYDGSPGWGLGSFAMRRRDRREHLEAGGSGSDGEVDPDAPPRQTFQMRSTSVSWWGPLSKWRLKDMTVY